MFGIVKLYVIAGPLKPKVYTFYEHETFIFGRAEDCHARLPREDQTASRHHFILEVNPPNVCIRDLGSRNGTFINGVRYGGRQKQESPAAATSRAFPAVDIQNGDRISVGETVFEVKIEHDASDGQEAHSTIQLIQCSLCGKKVSDEVSGLRSVEYICRACQPTALAGPVTILNKQAKVTVSIEDDSCSPSIFGYEIGVKLGAGAQGAVYLARREKDGSPVAIKVMLAKMAVDEDSRQRFHREVDVTCSLHHPNIVRLLEHSSSGSGFFFVMEFCPGGSVDEIMKLRGGRIPPSEAVPIILQALDGLSYAHAQGLVHRDLKPQNILLTEKEQGVAKISDFGLAKSFQKAGLSGMTATGTMIGGTLGYMSREQLINFKYAKPVSDVWSMGATLYFMLTGQLPRDFPRSQDPVAVILHNNAVPIRDRDSSIKEDLAEVIDCALSDKTGLRYQTASDFRDALAQVI